MHAPRIVRGFLYFLSPLPAQSTDRGSGDANDLAGGDLISVHSDQNIDEFGDVAIWHEVSRNTPDGVAGLSDDRSWHIEVAARWLGGHRAATEHSRCDHCERDNREDGSTPDDDWPRRRPVTDAGSWSDDGTTWREEWVEVGNGAHGGLLVEGAELGGSGCCFLGCLAP